MPPMYSKIWLGQIFSRSDGARWFPMAADYVEWSKLIGNLLGENLITCMECFLIFMLTSCLFQYCVRLFFGCNRLAGIWLSGIDEETCESMLEVWMKMHSLHIGGPGRHIQMHWGQIISCSKEPKKCKKLWRSFVDSEDPKKATFCREVAFVAIHAFSRDNIKIII